MVINDHCCLNIYIYTIIKLRIRLKNEEIPDGIFSPGIVWHTLNPGIVEVARGSSVATSVSEDAKLTLC